MSAPWFRVPSFLAKELCGDHKATEAEAWMELLGCWHIGLDLSACEFQRKTAWSKQKTLEFMPKAARWALENGANVPARWQNLKTDRATDRKPTGLQTGQNQVEPTKPESIRPETDRATDRIPTGANSSREETETEKRREEEIPPTPQPDPGWIGRAFERALGPAPIKPPERLPEPLPAPQATTEPKSVLIGAPIASPATSGLSWGHPSPSEAPRDLVSLLSSEPNGPQLVRCLFEAGIKSLEELQEIGPKKLQYCPGVGPGRKAQICRALAKQGIFLVDRIEAPVQPPSKRSTFLTELLALRDA